MNQPKWNIKNTRVYGDGKSFNCTNKITAETLYCTLTDYEKQINYTETTTTQFDHIQKQLIQIEMTLNILKHEIDTLHEAINNASTNKR